MSTDSPGLLIHERVLLVIRESWPLMGGLQWQALGLGKELVRHGHTFRIVTRFARRRRPLGEYFVRSERARVERHEGVPVEVIGHNVLERALLWPIFRLMWRKQTLPLAKAAFCFVFAKKIRRIALAEGATVIHFYGQGAELLGFAAAAAARGLELPFVVQPAVHVGQWGDGRIDLDLYRNADLILAHTKYEKAFFIAQGFEDQRVTVVGNGIDDCYGGDGASFRRRHGLGSDPVVLFLGRKEIDKGYHLTRAAVPIVLEARPDARFVFAGPENEAATGAAPAPLPASAAGNVLELGPISEQEKRDALEACTVLCVPSEGESFGLVFMEAWRCRKPVIGRALPVLKELFGRDQGGLLVGVWDEKLGRCVAESGDVAAAILKLLGDDRFCQRLGQEGHDRSEAFLWPNIFPRFLRAYQLAREIKREKNFVSNSSRAASR